MIVTIPRAAPLFDRRHMFGLGALFLAPNLGRARALSSGSLRWGIDYSPNTQQTIARTFDLLVLEPDHRRAIEPLRGPGAQLFGYISLGEVHRTRSYFSDLDRTGNFLKANPNWPDARYIDLRSDAWRRILLERLIPEILELRYNGIFIDTLDNAEAMETDDPIGNHGMVEAAASLICDIRTHFPEIKIILNRGYAVLPAVATQIDFALGEAMATKWDFVLKRYVRQTEADWEWQATRLRAAKALNAGLTLLTLDYWDVSDRAGTARLYDEERRAGFEPYVTTLQLDRLFAEPRP